jgi:hypothetical protein
MFKNESKTIVGSINDTNFKPIEYPYNSWMEEPIKFESVSNHLVTVMFNDNWQKKT